MIINFDEYDLAYVSFATVPSLPQLTALKKNEIELWLLTNNEIIRIHENAAKIEIARATKHYAEINNRYINSFDMNMDMLSQNQYFTLDSIGSMIFQCLPVTFLNVTRRLVKEDILQLQMLSMLNIYKQSIKIKGKKRNYSYKINVHF